MKHFFLAVVLYTLVLGMGVGALVYLRTKQPRIWNDCLTVLKAPDDSPIMALPVSSQAVVQAPAPSPVAPTPPAQASDQARGPTSNDGTVAPHEFVPPDPLPARQNWTWTVFDKVYKGVVVTQVEADRVHISYEGGVGTINTADLSPDLQKLFNYDPQLAAQATKARDEQQAKVDSEEAPKIAALQEQEAQQAAAEQQAESQKKATYAANLDAAARVDQARAQIAVLQDDLNFVTKHISINSQTGQVYGDNYYLTKYSQDTQGIAQCQQVINSGGK